MRVTGISLVLTVAAFGCAQQDSHSISNDTPVAVQEPEAGASARKEPPEPTGTSAEAPEPSDAVDRRETPDPPGTREVFAGVRINTDDRTVAFDGYVPLDAHDPETPIVYLELVACTPDTREHESLVATTAKPSHIHAAMLLIGLEPGSPGAFEFNRESGRYLPVAPRGPRVSVTITYVDSSGAQVTSPAAAWVIDQRSGETLAPLDGTDPTVGWIFSGSKVVEFRGASFYDADGSGTLIGLTTFGTETISWIDVYSHQASIQDPSWIANGDLVPRRGTPVEVVIRAVD